MLARLPWLYQHARVFTHDDGAVTEHPIPTRADVLAAFKSVPGLDVFELSPTHRGWADELIGWADGHPRLIPSHRSSYLGWQVDGRLVVKIDRASGGRLRVAAGVRPGSDSPKASGLVVELDGPLMDPEPLREAVRRAIPVSAAMTRMLRSSMKEDDCGVFVGASDADVVHAAGASERDGASLVDPVVSGPVVGAD